MGSTDEEGERKSFPPLAINFGAILSFAVPKAAEAGWDPRRKKKGRGNVPFLEHLSAVLAQEVGAGGGTFQKGIGVRQTSFRN